MTDDNKTFIQDGFITRYSKAAERKFLFYATAGMLTVWGLFKLLID